MVMETLQIRLTKELLNEISMLIDWGIYSSTSEAVRDAVRRLVTGVEAPIRNIPKQVEKEAKEVKQEIKPEVKEVKPEAREIIKKLDKEVKKQFQKPTGTLDFYPEDKETQNKIFEILAKTAVRFGFKEVDSPIIETMDLLKAKQGEEIKKQIFTIEKKGDEEFAIRAEFTPSLARMFVAKQKELQKPVKWFCINKVLRYERPQAGRLREFFQFNVEMYGSNKPEADAEMINLVIACMKNLGLNENDFFVKINNRELLQGLLLEIVDQSDLDKVISLIDKKAKITEEDFDKEAIALGLNEDKIKRIKKLINSSLKDLKPENELAKKGLDNLKEILTYVDNKYVQVDLATARGLAYYTGTVFEVYDKDEKFRSIAGGGRYDQMIELFKGEQTPATGFALGYATLSLLLGDKARIPSIDLSVDYFIVIVNDGVRQKAFEIANNLREKYRVEVDFKRANIGKQFKFANNIKAKKVIIVGPDELKESKVKIKDMGTGKEELVDIDDL